jgi:hypothetical protein
VVKTNRLLKAELAKWDNITYWNLTGLKDNHQDICWDGVHLNKRIHSFIRYIDFLISHTSRLPDFGFLGNKL